ncbi:MAG: signal peptidase I [Acidimicrobiales bacterium]
MTTTEPDRMPPEDASGNTSDDADVSRASQRKVRGPRSPWRRIVEWLLVFLLAAGAAVGIRAFLIQAFYIPSGSMLPTLQLGDRIIVDKLSYHLHAIHRGDIVVFATPPTDQGDPTVKDLVKRVIGLPGDRIASVNGHVTIGGRPISEPYLPTGTLTDSPSLRPEIVPQGEYFVMGDNRSDSKDSRIFGPIPGSLIVGRAVLRVWPLSHISVF